MLEMKKCTAAEKAWTPQWWILPCLFLSQAPSRNLNKANRASSPGGLGCGAPLLAQPRPAPPAAQPQAPRATRRTEGGSLLKGADKHQEHPLGSSFKSSWLAKESSTAVSTQICSCKDPSSDLCITQTAQSG